MRSICVFVGTQLVKGSFIWGSGSWVLEQQVPMEHNHEGLEDDFPLQTGDFQFPLIFQGEIWIWKNKEEPFAYKKRVTRMLMRTVVFCAWSFFLVRWYLP